MITRMKEEIKTSNVFHFIHCFLHPFGESHLRTEFEDVHRFFGCADGTVNVTGTRFGMNMHGGIGENSIKDIQEIEQAGFDSGTNVEDLPGAAG